MEQKYYIFSVRVTKKGNIVHKEKIRRIWNRSQMRVKEEQLKKQYEVTLSEIAYSYEEYAGFAKTCSMLLNEMRSSLYNVRNHKK